MTTDFAPTAIDLQRLFELKYGVAPKLGWGPAMRRKFNYFFPDDYYEALVCNLVDENTSWLDVGCGRNLFPSNRELARSLSERCKLLVGVEPDPNIQENEFVHEKVQCSLEEFRIDRTFDLITMRMVVEHIENPAEVMAALQRLTKRGSKIVIYTVNKWSPVPLVTRMLPFGLHHFVKHLFWQTVERDTFPVKYLMNTKVHLEKIFQTINCAEVYFSYLEDLSIFARCKSFCYADLYLRKLLHKIGLNHPERNLLGVYQRV